MLNKIRNLIMRLNPKFREMRKAYKNKDHITFICPDCITTIDVPITEDIATATVPECPKCGPKANMIYPRCHIGYLQMIGRIPGTPEVI